MKRSLGVVFFMLVASNASAANVCVTAADKGQDLRAAGKLDEARASFLVCAKASCNRVVRADCERWIKEIDATPAPVVEEKEAAPPPPSPPAQPVRVSIAMSESPAEEAPSPASARTRATSAPAPIASIVLGGIGVASLAAFGFFQVQGWSRHSDLESGCGKTHSCTDDDIAPARSQFVASGVALGISAVAFGAAAILYFTRGSSAPSSRVGITAHGAALSF